MTPIATIVNAINNSMKSVEQHTDYPNTSGLYAFKLGSGSVLKEFGSSNQIIYVGKAEDSLAKRDLKTHFKNGCTGSSTLRRSIGAILKSDFKGRAFSRNGTLNKLNIDKYKFDSNTEVKLSQWMKSNLQIGFWKYETAKEDMPLGTIEEQLIIALKPSLDLDRRTRRYNAHATRLSALREACKKEATENVLKKVAYC